MPGPAVILAPLLMELAKNGLGMIAGAIQAKGKQVVEKELGITIPDNPSLLTTELLHKLQIKQIDHEEFLVNAAIRRQEIEMEAEAKGQAQVTDRWKTDMTSDSWLSKNVRPLTLVYWTIAITALILMDSAGTAFKVKDAWINLVETITSLIYGAYFLGRTVQHVGKMWKDKGK